MAENGLRIRTLGGLSIECDGLAVTNFASRKAEALLVYLACNPRQHPRETLAELLWDDRSQRQAMANLRVVLSSLRKEVGPFVTFSRTFGTINNEADVWLDVAELEQHAVTLQKSDGIENAATAGVLLAALELYTGDFLAGYFLPEAAGFESWAAAERERLHRLAMDGLQRLGQWYLMQGDYPPAIAAATRQVQIDAIAEAGHRQLMEALARNRQRAEALAQYETCRAILLEELGLEPEMETQALFEAIRQDKLPLPVPPSQMRVTEVPAMPAFLTDPPISSDEGSRFWGRRQVLQRLKVELQEVLAGDTRVFFISGEAGAGKSALVDEFARRAADDVPDLLVAVGHNSALSSGEGAYQPFQQILGMLAGDLEDPYLAGVLSQEMARRLWAQLPDMAQALTLHAPHLPGVFVNGRALLGRLASVLPGREAWRDQLERIVSESQAARGELDGAVLRKEYVSLLRVLAKNRPLLLILEDLHWADTATLELLFQLGQHSSAAKLFLLATFRPEEAVVSTDAGRNPFDKVLAKSKRIFGDVVVDLDAVVAAEGEDFVDEVLRAEQIKLEDSFRNTLLDHTGGHPLFSIELLRAMRLRGDLQQGADGSWQAATEFDWTRLPGRIEGVLEERVGRLDTVSRQLLDVAAVEGEQFSAQVIAKALDLPERDVVRRLGNELERQHRLIRSLGTRHLGQQRLSLYRFSHNLFQQYLYESLPDAEHSYLHEDVGDALEKLHAGKTEEVVGKLAWHFSEAGVAEKGIRYSLQAGDQASMDYAHEQAAVHYENALRFLRERGEENQTARILMKLGLTYQMALRYRRARQVFEEGFHAWRRAERVDTYAQLPPAPHAFRILYKYEPHSLDPTRQREHFAAEITGQLFSGLTESHGPFEVGPGVAYRWETENGGRRLIFYLRPDIHWSDGHPLTAEDFVCAWRRTMHPEYSYISVGGSMFNIKGARDVARGAAPAETLGVQVADSHTLVVELERSSAQFLQESHFPIPLHMVRRYGDEWANPEHLVVNGPFKLTRWQSRQQLSFERNPYYHGRFQGNVERVNLLYWPGSQEVKLEMYERGELDCTSIGPAEFRRARQRHAADYASFPNAQTIVLCFDLDREPFNDIRVRSALAQAIDREQLADIHLEGLLFPATGGLIPPSLAGHSANINIPFDPQRARTLLAQAGYEGGRSFPSVTARMFGSLEGWPMASARQAIQAQWQQVLDLDIELEAVSWAEPVDDAHLYIAGWIDEINANPGFFLDSFVSSYIPDAEANHEALSVVLAQARETDNLQRRLEFYQQADRLLVQESYASPLLYGRTHILIKPWLRGFSNDVRWKNLVIEPY